MSAWCTQGYICTLKSQYVFSSLVLLQKKCFRNEPRGSVLFLPDLSYRIWSLCQWFLRVLCSLAFGRVLTGSIYLVTSKQNWTQLTKDICVASGVVAKSYKLQFPGMNLVPWMSFSPVSLSQVWGQLLVAFSCLSSSFLSSEVILTFILKLTSIPFPLDRWMAHFPPGEREKEVQ